MKINKITITGADDRTKISDLVQLQKDYPFVEWGILFSKEQGRPRYPSLEWIAELQEAKLPALSAHLCGQFSRDIMQSGNERFFTEPQFCAGQFKRIQLNYNFTNTPFDLKYLEEIVEKRWEYAFILQYNKSNSKTVETVMKTMTFQNIHVLYDASGGRGREIEVIPQPFDFFYTGYSGGLSPSNIEQVCEKVKALNAKDDQLFGPNNPLPWVWLDMESGVRTDDVFDLDKIKKVLEIAAKYVEVN